MKAVGCRLKAVGRNSMRAKRIQARFFATLHINLMDQVRARVFSLATAYSLQPTASPRGASA